MARAKINSNPESASSGNVTVVAAPSLPSMAEAVTINSNPVTSSLVPETSGALVASPSSSNTPEASCTARKAPCGSLLGEPSRILDRASLSLAGPLGDSRLGMDFEDMIAALESEWLTQCISLKNSDTLRTIAQSDNISKSVSARA